MATGSSPGTKRVVKVLPPQRTETGPDGAPHPVMRYGYPGYIITYIYEDGTVEPRFFFDSTAEPYDPKNPDKPGKPGTGLPPAEGEGSNGILLDPSFQPDLVPDEFKPPKPGPIPSRTPEQIAVEQNQAALQQQQIEAGQRDAAEAARVAAEKQHNADTGGNYETNAERAVRESKALADQRAQDAVTRQAAIDKRAAEQQAEANRIAQENVDISRGRLTLEQQQANKPEILPGNTDTPYITRYNPQTQEIEQVQNPNFDAVKQESERQRQLLTAQIQARQITLDEAKQQYTQWYDSNVKTPLLMAQEARDKAAEQRAALDAEERRRQFAADFSLQRGQLGERAGEAAMQAEESLLPYRAGPTESAEMSSAINSLAAGGTPGSNAAAGIHFTPDAFTFNAPDFKSIAQKAAAAALKGISSYTPSSQSYQTADYSGVPAVSTNAPAIPSGYGAFQGIIDNLKSTYNFGGNTTSGGS